MHEDLKQVLRMSERIRIDILLDCKITRATLHNWENGKTPIPFWAKEKINRITLDVIGKETFQL